MNFRSSRTTFGIAGPTSIFLPFTPTGVMVFVGPKGTSNTDSAQHICHGAADGSLQNCISVSSAGTKGYGDRLISHWEGGSEVLRVNFVSFGTNQINLDVITPNSQYQVYMRYMG